jgi:hypothetical protein
MWEWEEVKTVLFALSIKANQKLPPDVPNRQLSFSPIGGHIINPVLAYSPEFC